MLYKRDWDQAKERLTAWWEGELTDRPVVQVTGPREPRAPAASSWDILTPSNFLQGIEYVIRLFDAYCEQTYFGGEAFPNLWINLGPGSLAAYLGAEPQVRTEGNTTWFEDPRGWEELQSAGLDEDNDWWTKTCQWTAEAATRGRGKHVVGMTDIGGNLDVAASLRGTQRLAMDLIESPERVKRLCEGINQTWFEVYSELHAITTEGGQEGSAAWMGIWAPGTWYPIQCDFSAMISPGMFEAFALPYLVEECRWLDYAIYHWDGPAQIPHLDALLEIEELDGIQWVPGAGAEPTASPRWLPLYRQILGNGKNLVLEVQPQDVAPLIEELGGRGLLLQTACATEGEAEALLQSIPRSPRSWAVGP